ncbi:MFS transporter [Bacillus cereus]
MAVYHYLILFGPFTFLSFLTRIATSFFDPASFSYKTMLIRAEERAQFNAWSNFCTSGAFIIGPALAGILLTTHSATFVIYCNSLSFLLSTIFIYFLPNIALQTKQNEEVANTFVQTLRNDWNQVFFICSNRNLHYSHIRFISSDYACRYGNRFTRSCFHKSSTAFIQHGI